MREVYRGIGLLAVALVGQQRVVILLDIVSPGIGFVGIHDEAQLGYQLLGGLGHIFLAVVDNAVVEYHEEDADEEGCYQISQNMVNIQDGLHILLLGMSRKSGHDKDCHHTRPRNIFANLHLWLQVR